MGSRRRIILSVLFAMSSKAMFRPRCTHVNITLHGSNAADQLECSALLTRKCQRLGDKCIRSERRHIYSSVTKRHDIQLKGFAKPAREETLNRDEKAAACVRLMAMQNNRTIFPHLHSLLAFLLTLSLLRPQTSILPAPPPLASISSPVAKIVVVPFARCLCCSPQSLSHDKTN